MIKNKIAFLALVTILALSCGQGDTSSSKAAESTKDVQNKENSVSDDTESSDTKDITIDQDEIIAEEGVTIETNTNDVKGSEANKAPKPVNVSKKEKAPSQTIKNTKETVAVKAEDTPMINKTPEMKEMPKEEKEMVTKEAPAKEDVKVPTAAFTHETFNQLLQKHVSSNGNVNYNNFKADEPKLDAYLKALEQNAPTDNWSKGKKMAYWINAYNAGTIKLILKNHPISSITKLHGGKPWDQKWIPLGGKTYSLDQIENDILRPVYKDARIHFAVNCAAKSCPPLLNKAWTEDNLNKYLKQQTKSFINDPAQNTLSAKAVEISKIFEWYAKDFGNIIDFLNQYSETKIDANAKVTYKDYNWDLNK